MSNYLRITCPHCASDVVINLNVTEVKMGKSMGPAPYDPGPEIDAYVLEKIDTKRVSFQTLAELLEEREVATAKGGKKWHAASARRLYIGANARREQSKNPNPN